MHENGKDEITGRSGRQNNSKRAVRILEERYMGTKRKSPKQVLITPEDLTTMLSVGRDPPYNISD